MTSGIYISSGKRLLDVTLALLGLLALSPVMLVIATMIRLRMGAPVLFKHQRPGFKGRPFYLWKFRTMVQGSGTDAERITPFGRALRSTSLDELPELYNVLRGDMSLVGPRPLKMEYLELYTPEQMRRHDVRPGLTGWAQVNGRNAQTWEDRFRFDLWYVDHVSFGLDIKIIWLTVWRVIRREGISADGHATMPRFQGTPRPH
jgi:lipopolysaccharide/colanic/teichoic acid biosynthesis glycosyltransferase